MTRKQLRLSRLSIGLISALAMAPALAQSTSAGVGGVVSGSDGQPVAGAEVTITHVESGTVSRATTDASGRYNARGLRVGGPYTITVVKEGAGTDTEENVFLNLDRVNQVDMGLQDDVTTLATVQAIAVGGSDVFSADKMGTGTNINGQMIEAYASIQRSVQDYARLDPRISQTDKERGEISALGQNSRFNAITIDSVTTNDTFGLEANNLPLMRQPVSIDAIEEINIDVANYDVEQKGYTGARINAVTKSGTNNFDGSVYYIFRKNDWIGDEPSEFSGFEDEETYGATFGGPLLKDKLFFFLTYEKFQRTAPGATFGPIGSGASQEYGDLTQADVQRFADIAAGYGLTPGSTTAPDALNTEVEEYLAKFDWNINDYHRASFRYTNTEQSDAILPNLDNDEYSLSSHWYNQVKTFESYVGQLYSDWTDNFSTEVSLSYRDYNSAPQTFSRQPQVIVDAGSVNLHLGTEQFRHANLLETKTFNGFFAGELFLGDHTLKVGVDYESNDVYNLFLESSLGNWFFSSLDDFENGLYDSYLLRASADGNLNSAAADWTYKNLGLFVQDTWAATDNLTLTFGVRYDEPMVDDRPVFNQDALDTFGYRNDATIDGNGLLQPRFGFNYTFDADRPTQLRGGVGLFQGAAASVWLSNPFTNNGLTIEVFEDFTGTLPFTPDPDNQPRPASAPPAADVDIIASDLEQPSIWKANLAFDHELPWYGMVATAEIVLTKTETGIHYEHLNLGAPTGTGQDGRLMYWNPEGYDPTLWNQFGSNPDDEARFNRDRDYRDVLLARETDKGNGSAVTLMLSKPMDEHWSWSLGYTYSNATEVSPLTSSRAISNWNGRAIFDPNEEIASRANYVTQDRVTGSLNFRYNFFGDYKTEFSVFYEGRSGKPYSYTFDNDANGDGIFGNDLLYVPAGPGDVLFGSAEEEAAFWEFVNSDDYLSGSMGSVARRNAAQSPWVNNFDVRISQELPGFYGDNKAEIWLDILNIGNLINEDWGQIEEVFFPFNRGVVEYGGVDPDTGKYVYRFNNPDSLGLRDRNAESRWALQVGFRYKF